MKAASDPIRSDLTRTSIFQRLSFVRALGYGTKPTDSGLWPGNTQQSYTFGQGSSWLLPPFVCSFVPSPRSASLNCRESDFLTRTRSVPRRLIYVASDLEVLSVRANLLLAAPPDAGTTLRRRVKRKRPRGRGTPRDPLDLSHHRTADTVMLGVGIAQADDGGFRAILGRRAVAAAA
jgi:hypothetical protein